MKSPISNLYSPGKRMQNSRNLLIIIGSVAAVVILVCGCYFIFVAGSSLLSDEDVAGGRATPAPRVSPPPPPTPDSSPTPLPLPTATEPPTPTATPVVPDTSTPSPTSAPDPAETVPEPTPTETVQSSAPAKAELQEAFVIYVVDGDSIDVVIDNVEYRVDYILIDAPDSRHSDKPVEPFGPEAYEINKSLVEGRTVFLEKDVTDSEQPSQLLRYVYVDGLMVNQELLRLGLAQVVPHPPDQKYVDRFMAIQQEAQAARVGMWAE